MYPESLCLVTSVGEVLDRIAITELKLVHTPETDKARYNNLLEQLAGLYNISLEIERPFGNLQLDNTRLLEFVHTVCRELSKTVAGSTNKQLLVWLNICDDFYRLFRANRLLWKLEDRIRMLIRQSNYGPDFIRVAKLIPLVNDKRATCKNNLNKSLRCRVYDDNKIYKGV